MNAITRAIEALTAYKAALSTLDDAKGPVEAWVTSDCDDMGDAEILEDIEEAIKTPPDVDAIIAELQVAAKAINVAEKKTCDLREVLLLAQKHGVVVPTGDEDEMAAAMDAADKIAAAIESTNNVRQRWFSSEELRSECIRFSGEIIDAVDKDFAVLRRAKVVVEAARAHQENDGQLTAAIRAYDAILPPFLDQAPKKKLAQITATLLGADPLAGELLRASQAVVDAFGTDDCNWEDDFSAEQCKAIDELEQAFAKIKEVTP